MRFLFAFAAVLGYASAGVLGPLVYGANPGDVQAAHIDAAVAAQDHVRAVGEGQVRAAEAAIQYNTEVVRQTAEAHRDINENAYWNSVAAGQNLVAAAQTQQAALDGAAAAYRAAHVAAPALGYAAPYGIAPYGLAAPYGIHGLGLHY
ncbi:cuticle protein 1 [Plutella xylostella]|uniref:cuticle protein 1 n=1 Tax=Plutella xylostella TaxID=51655 RepID=UPI002032632A|nr:cuticle protein 1 [Plutella xylostella]